MKTATPFARSACAVANSLDILGDKWSLLVVRDLLHGKSTYGELRFRRSVSQPIFSPIDSSVWRVPASSAASPIKSVRYGYAYAAYPEGQRTGRGVAAYVRWGKQHIPGTVALNQGPAGERAGRAQAQSTRAR